MNLNNKYAQNRDPVLTGYIITNTIVADIHDIRQVGLAIDAALTAGANVISSLDFYASNTNSARYRAIAEGVEKARSEAEVAAKAAGGLLGTMISIEIDAASSIPPRPVYSCTMAASTDAAPTPINPGQQTLTVRVFTRWQFLSAGVR